jgi:hypothetical protein
MQILMQQQADVIALFLFAEIAQIPNATFVILEEEAHRWWNCHL